MHPVNREILEKVFLNQLKTTYQLEYTGLQKGKLPKQISLRIQKGAMIRESVEQYLFFRN